MPILVKDYTWTQSCSIINIRIPLEPVYREKVDLFTTDKYVKAHFSPFLFEIFLLHEVDSTKGKCIISEDLILLELHKKEEVEWKSLEKVLSKEEKFKLRNEILLECQEKAVKESEERAIRKSQLDRFTVQKAMDIDSQQHALIDARRDEERNKVMNDLETWRSETTGRKYNRTTRVIDNTKDMRTSAKIIELTDDLEDNSSNAKITEIENVALERKVRNKKFTKSSKTLIRSEYVDKKKEEITKRVLPKLRETAQLEIKHTPRYFPTPSRESAAREEEAWLKNITLARRATGFVSEDLRPEEQDPQWCKEKGDEFFRNGNFLGAISAYTHGITLSDKLPTPTTAPPPWS
ncbi:unnamed protein product [Leptidea sinapis]|uniref:CS domain-containing protein n=1 Tax=Leptidea sinapis TaxID=189913 RepID=A0A5E4QC08_9NEOP|nr:unnamed protein product [Leptidea sinapis]